MMEKEKFYCPFVGKPCIGVKCLSYIKKPIYKIRWYDDTKKETKEVTSTRYTGWWIFRKEKHESYTETVNICHVVRATLVSDDFCKALEIDLGVNEHTVDLPKAKWEPESDGMGVVYKEIESV